ncbi:predicted protein [Plenodomus lingam JN3]|uniref:Predicted protein n=1 Tax=Leptosphaeria maculans (strain JN3 / isolate v23.1.3 / race Av1-4-5-6-7-8) TaxID=985895 RepID=E5A268_LEPMJ|nr:predicted protein [Plenodomus lingam JN3]CBX97945.1 predicted protein [Plenodomus lingam JN3]
MAERRKPKPAGQLGASALVTDSPVMSARACPPQESSIVQINRIGDVHRMQNLHASVANVILCS